MLYINLNLYRVFYIVAQSKSYSDAADKLHLSVPSISVSINKLEKLLNTLLFYREKNGVKLTEEGKELLGFIEKGLKFIDLGEKHIVQKSNLENGEITIGCQSHLATFYFMNVIGKARKDHPNLKINIVTNLNVNEMLDMLQNHKIDFLIDICQGDNKYKNIISEELKVVHNTFISKNKIKINDKKEFESFDLILDYDFDVVHKELVDIFEKNNINVSPKFQFDKTEMIIEAVNRNLGIGYVMKELVEKELASGELFEVKIPGIEYPNSSIRLNYINDQLTVIDRKFIKNYLKS